MSTEAERPKTMLELAHDRASDGVRVDWASLPRAPHCDSRILHLPTECDFCRDSPELQAERERLEISNSGHANRRWPCPADQARGKAQYNAWGGNKPKTYEQVEQEAHEFAEQLKSMGLVVDK